MKKIPLTQGKYALVDDEDFDYLNRWKWYVKVSKGKWYAVRNESYGGNGNRKQRTVYLHRFVVKAPAGMDTDHKNGDSLDNQRQNLRICSHKENCRNKAFHSRNTSGFKGVTWNKREKTWRAQICVDYKKIIIGRFRSPEDAALAYDSFAKKVFGDYALTNFLQ